MKTSTTLHLLTTLAWCCSGGLAAAQTIALPVEVISATQVTEVRELPLANLNEAAFVYARIHGLQSVEQASVRLNDGPWYDLGNQYITERDNQYGGVGGGYHTLRYFIPAEAFGGFDPGAPNPRISFRYNGTNGKVTGYRVIGLNVLADDGSSLIANSAFAFDNPGDWEAPIAGQAAVDRGEALWNTAQLVDVPGGTMIRATCGDCHTKRGEDLEYFAYSNRSIRERSKFHGLSEQEGNEIASYIRSLRGVYVSGRLGRPYNPPYQPGTSLADKPVEYWAAGAGIAEVGDDEAELLAAFLNRGTAREQIEAVVDPDASIDLTVIPIGIQLPDWNEWLPEVHPKDVWEGTYFDDANVYKNYVAFSTRLENNTNAAFNSNSWRFDIGALQQEAREFMNVGRREYRQGISQWRTQESATTDKIVQRYKTNNNAEFAKEQLAKFVAVKYFEMIKLNKLEDRAREQWPEADRWQWPMNRQSVHQIAPHILAYNINNFVGRDPLVDEFASTAWYQLQMTLNSGQGLNRQYELTVEPVDWPYQFRHIWEANERKPNGRHDGMRYYLTLAKMYQVVSNGNGPYQVGYQTEYTQFNGDHRTGWIMRYVHPVLISAMIYQGKFDLMDTPDEYESGLSGRLQTALLNTWLKVANRYEENEWLRQKGNYGNNAFTFEKWDKLEPRNQVPDMNIQYPQANDRMGGPVTARFFSTGAMNHIDHLYKLIDLLERRPGIECQTIRGLAEWGQARWPNGDWVERLAEPTCAPLPVDYSEALAAESELDDVTLTWATATELGHARFELERSADAETWAAIAEFPSRGEASHYMHVDLDLPAGTYYYRLAQHDRDGSVAYSDQVAATVVGDGPGTTATDGPRARVTEGILHVDQLPADAEVTVYDPLGRPIHRGPAAVAAEGFQVGTLRPGVYHVSYRGSAGAGVLEVVNLENF